MKLKIETANTTRKSTPIDHKRITLFTQIEPLNTEAMIFFLNSKQELHRTKERNETCTSLNWETNGSAKRWQELAFFFTFALLSYDSTPCLEHPPPLFSLGAASFPSREKGFVLIYWRWSQTLAPHLTVMDGLDVILIRSAESVPWPNWTGSPLLSLFNSFIRYFLFLR